MRKETFERSRLKANDRKRMRQREDYARFVEGYVHSRTENISERRNELDTRKIVLEEASHAFRKKEEYELRREEWRIEMLNAPIKKELMKLRIREEVEYGDAWIKYLREAMVANSCV